MQLHNSIAIIPFIWVGVIAWHTAVLMALLFIHGQAFEYKTHESFAEVSAHKIVLLFT